MLHIVAFSGSFLLYLPCFQWMGIYAYVVIAVTLISIILLFHVFFCFFLFQAIYEKSESLKGLST